jgi:hypothetical protein
VRAVSQHLPWLKPTARNKMWNAVIDSKATARGFKDLYGLPDRGHPSLEQSLCAVGIPLLFAASRRVQLAMPSFGGVLDTRVGVVSSLELLDLFAKITWHPEFLGVIRPLRKFLSTATTNGRVADWAVVWPLPTKNVMRADLPGFGEAPVIKRSRRPERYSFVGSDSKHRDAALPIARAEGVEGLEMSPGRGAVLVYLVDDRPNGSAEVLSASTSFH